jgi:tRNA uridine 5-carbamoylmethylation protein Kti12
MLFRFIRATNLESQPARKRQRTKKAAHSTEIIEYDESNDIEDDDFQEEQSEETAPKDNFDSNVDDSYVISFGLQM